AAPARLPDHDRVAGLDAHQFPAAPTVAGTQPVDLLAHLGDLFAQVLDLGGEFDDPPDALQVDALVLRQALDLAQQGDVTARVAASAACGAGRDDQPDPVVGAQGLGVHAGHLGGDRDAEQHTRLRGAVRPLGPPVAALGAGSG